MSLTHAQWDMLQLMGELVIEHENMPDPLTSSEISSYELSHAMRQIPGAAWSGQYVSVDSAARRMVLLRMHGLVTSKKRRHLGHVESVWSLTDQGRSLCGLAPATV